MRTIRAIIIDDEPLAHKVILQYARDVPFLEIVNQCYKATDAYAVLQNQEIDLLFLDIQMPKLKGLDFLRTLHKKPKVIITSAYQEYALEGYELQVTDYLLKPFRFDRFLKAVHLVQQQLNANPDIRSSDIRSLLTSDQSPEVQSPDVRSPDVRSLLTSDPNARLFLKVDKRFQQVEVADIIYLESYGNYVKVWMGDTFLLTPRTLSSFVEELSEEAFLRIHKSYFVQKAEIDYVEGNLMRMKNGVQLPIGKSYRAKVKEWVG
jgi:DNA-binding LytR/AlgR family response regulator